MTDTLQAVDLSVYQGSIDQPTWRAMMDDGIELAIVGSAHPYANGHAEGNLLRAQAVGLRIATYVALGPNVTGAATVATGKQACGRTWKDLAFVAVDCEVNGITQPQIQDAAMAVKAEGLRPIIYSAYWWWHGHFGNPQTFKGLPLWNAYYDNDPDFDFQKAPYGGWTIEMVVGEQYTGSTAFHGTTVDRNTFLRSFIEQEDHMPTPEYEELTKRIDDLTKALALGAQQLQSQVTTLKHNLAATNKLLGDGLTNHETRLKAGGH